MSPAAIYRDAWSRPAGRAWLCLSTALAVHVADEALTGFLPFYNALVESLRERLGFFPMPTFEFSSWLGGLIVGICVLFAVAPVMSRASASARFIAVIFGVLMIGNGLGHLLGSAYFERLLPGFWSAPLVLAAAVFTVYAFATARSREA